MKSNNYYHQLIHGKVFILSGEVSAQVWKIPLSKTTQICQNMGFLWSVYSRIRTYKNRILILSLYGNIRVRENEKTCILTYCTQCNIMYSQVWNISYVTWENDIFNENATNKH